MKEEILKEYEKGNVVVVGAGSVLTVLMDEFIKQPIEGILYDLNIGEAVVLSSTNDPKWVNAYATCKTITSLKKRIEELQKDERLLELTKRHKAIMDDKNIVISVYTNASGFLWSMCKVDSGTDLGWCVDVKKYDHFDTYEDALESAINLIDKCTLDQYANHSKEYNHWGSYVDYIGKLK